MEFHCGYYEQNVSVVCMNDCEDNSGVRCHCATGLWPTEPALGSFPSDNLSSRFTSCYGSPQKEEKKTKNEHGEIKMSVPSKLFPWGAKYGCDIRGSEATWRKRGVACARNSTAIIFQRTTLDVRIWLKWLARPENRQSPSWGLLHPNCNIQSLPVSIVLLPGISQR